MTCEVAVMNKRGIALAADSAVALGNSNKVYHTAEKLFPLSPSIPVAIMTFGAANMMGVPWETIVKIYAQKLAGRRFETLVEYAQDFLAFVEGATSLFPVEDQKDYVGGAVRAVWSGLYRDKLANQMANDPTTADRDAADVLAEIIREDHAIWAKYPDLEELSPDYGAHVVETYAAEIDEVEAEVFEGNELSPTIRRDLRQTVRLIFGKEWFHPAEESGLVLAGMGESEPFPALLQYRIGTVAAGKLRYAKADETRIGPTNAAVLPFAQRETIDMIIGGIHPMLMRKLVNDVAQWFPNASEAGEEEQPNRINQIQEALRTYIREEILEQYDQPFMSSVAALPRQDLAKMAEALVSLTAFLMRMSADQSETVAEPIDVAVLSKGDGFIWVKHKDLIQEAGRLGPSVRG